MPQRKQGREKQETGERKRKRERESTMQGIKLENTIKIFF
jgi:hypothetical protein